MQINKKDHPDILTFEDVEEVLNDVDPQDLYILAVKRHNKSSLSFGSQMQSTYRGIPLIFQENEFLTRAEAITDWQNQFLMIFNSARARLLLAKIAKQHQEINNLSNLDIWKDETISETAGHNITAASHKEISKSNNLTGNLNIAKGANKQTDHNSRREIEELNCRVVEIHPEEGEKKELEGEFELATANFKVVNKTKDINTSLLSTEAESGGSSASANNYASNNKTTFSNASKDIRDFFNTDLQDYNSQFIFLFRELFRWRNVDY